MHDSLDELIYFVHVLITDIVSIVYNMYAYKIKNPKIRIQKLVRLDEINKKLD